MKEVISFFLVSLLVIMNANTGQSQTWFPENAEWYYTAWCIIDPQCGFLRYYAVGDTMLAGKAAVIVNSQFESAESTASFAETHYFSVENDTVFHFSDSTNTWGMLYDFNAQPGDVWDLTETLPVTIYSDWDGQFAALIEVDSVTTEMLGGTMRRVIHTSPWYNEEEMEPGSDWMFYGPIVEGIGPVGGSTRLFGESVIWSPGGYAPHFSCYREDDELVYGSDEFPCGVVSSVADLEVQEMKIFPNPAHSQIQIQLPEDINRENLGVQIYSISGQLMVEKVLPNTFQPEIQTHELTRGTYFLRVTAGEFIGMGQFVIIK